MSSQSSSFSRKNIFLLISLITSFCNCCYSSIKTFLCCLVLTFAFSCGNSAIPMYPKRDYCWDNLLYCSVTVGSTLWQLQQFGLQVRFTSKLQTGRRREISKCMTVVGLLVTPLGFWACDWPIIPVMQVCNVFCIKSAIWRRVGIRAVSSLLRMRRHSQQSYFGHIQLKNC